MSDAGFFMFSLLATLPLKLLTQISPEEEAGFVVPEKTRLSIVQMHVFRLYCPAKLG